MSLRAWYSDLRLVPLHILLRDHPGPLPLARRPTIRVLLGVGVQPEATHHVLELMNAGETDTRRLDLKKYQGSIYIDRTVGRQLYC